MEKVVIKLNAKREHFNNVPKELKSEVSKKVSPEWKKNGSKDITRGLTHEQELIAMPNLIGVQPNDPNWTFKVRDFWADFSVNPTEKGLVLDISTRKVKNGTDKDGNDIEIDFPNNIEDYMAYKVCMQSSLVAKTQEDMQNVEHFDFILIDKQEEEKKELDAFEVQANADIKFSRLISKYSENESTIDWVLELLRDKKDSQIFTLDATKKKMMLRAKKEKSPETFLKIVDDKDLESKAIIAQLLTYNIISRDGNDYYFLDEKIGSDMAMIAYLKDATKSTNVAKMKSHLETKINADKNQ